MLITEILLRTIIRESLAKRDFVSIGLNTKHVLNEAELRYSQTALNAAFELVKKYKSGKIGFSEQIEVPGKEIYYMNNLKIKNGAILFNFLNIQNVRIDQIDGFAQYWNNQTKKFDMGLIDNPMPVKLDVVIKAGGDKLGGAGVSSDGLPFISVYPDAHVSDEQLKNTIRHELQHTAQKVNGTALNYGEQLVKENGNFSKITKIKISAGEFGTGSQKTGLRQISVEDAKARGISEEERTKSYLGDDFEYETWLSDMLSDLLNWTIKNKFIKVTALRCALLKEKFPNFGNFPNQNAIPNPDAMNEAASAELQDIVKQSKELNMQPKQLIDTIKSSESFNQISVYITKTVLQDKRMLEIFARNSNMISYVKAVKLLSTLRKTEFTSDLIKNFEIKLREYAVSKFGDGTAPNKDADR
jgi:hypothetical protein